MLIKEAIGTGSSVEEAKENALRELAAGPEEDVSIEVLDTGKKKSFGLFGGSPAKVRAYYEVADSAAKEKKVKEKKAERAPQKEEKVKDVTEGKSLDELTPGSKAEKAAKYLISILEKLGCDELELKFIEIDGGIKIYVSGNNTSIIIGRRGETLDAIQHLTSLAANAGESGYYRVVLNTGDYRERREQTLIALANRMAAQAIRAQKCRTLEPMNPYERRIIHTAVQEIEGVSSTSFGEGEQRRVVIAPDGVTPKPRSERRSRGFSDRGRSGRSSRSKSYVASPTNREQQKDAEDMPLYGKIEL